ncbi:hypothetical protein DFA_12129 [Cavenderia fasciculata]|uniref:Leucine-rich repeat-containing protein n=1 Tax=Cavenderia fasciculata TaxID=261658 RepID=F4QC77_CACFS|nr:uncharacterized protein DFA_12129 [Cavenderia fasciculata]EGG14358.1 hypothetical protein DFA_12129 [Cavenderia fasciculata]|eukprot:XP_004351080.1 hypothetical protein DFA_12129 [Cavenderia fasciculata]
MQSILQQIVENQYIEGLAYILGPETLVIQYSILFLFICLFSIGRLWCDYIAIQIEEESIREYHQSKVILLKRIGSIDLENRKDSSSTCVFLSKYIQSIIIGKLIDRIDNHGRDERSRLMYSRGEPTGSNKFVGHHELINIAMVSKWWLKVTRQSTPNLKIKGPLKESCLSFFNPDTVSALKWNVIKWYDTGDYSKCDYNQFDYTKLPQLLQQLKSINIATHNIEESTLETVEKVVNAFPHISPNIHILIRSSESKLVWPKNINIMKSIKPTITITLEGEFEWQYEDDDSFMEDFYQMIDDLDPSHLNLFWNSYIDYSLLLQHLTPTIKHLNFPNDSYYGETIKLSQLKHYVAKPYQLESLNTCILFDMNQDEIVINEDGNNEDDGDDDDVINQDGNIEDGEDDINDNDGFIGDDAFGNRSKHWKDFCFNLCHNKSLKRLKLKDKDPKQEFFHYERWARKKGMEIESKSLTLDRLASSFIPIWDKNNKIELVGLTSLPQIISPLFFTTLVNNQTITTLMLTHYTLRQEYIPSFSQLLVINTTIKRVCIRNNHLESSKELEMAFKQNKSIIDLDITGNHFGNTFFSALLESDTIQYLVIDREMKDLNHPYFNQSKSLIQFF